MVRLHLRTMCKALLIGLLASLLQFLTAQGPLMAQINPRQNVTAADLERYEITVNSLLRTFRDEEKQFISDVFDLIRAGSVPKEIVDRSLHWVRKNKWYSNYKFIYFERVLRIHADNLGVAIPAFDNSIYTVRQR